MATPDTTPVHTPFDNQVSVRFKWASYWKVPWRLVTVKHLGQASTVEPTPYRVVVDGDVLTNVYQQMRSMPDFGTDLYDLFHEFRKNNTDVSADDIAMIYWAEMLTRNNIRPYRTDPIDVFSEEEMAPNTIRQNLLLAINYFYNKTEMDGSGDKFHNLSSLQNFYNNWVQQWQRELLDDKRKVEQLNDINATLLDIDHAGDSIQSIIADLNDPERQMLYSTPEGVGSMLERHERQHPGLAGLLGDLRAAITAGGKGDIVDFYNKPITDSTGRTTMDAPPLIINTVNGPQVNKLVLTNMLTSMSRMTNVLIGTPNYNMSTATYNPYLKHTGAPVATSDGIDIFNNIVMSKYVSYVQYNGHWDHQRYFKVFRVDKHPILDDGRENQGNKSRNRGQDVMHMLLWIGADGSGGSGSGSAGSGSDDSNLEQTSSDKLKNIYGKAQKDSFRWVKYDLTTNELMFTMPLSAGSGLQSTALERLKQAMPFFDFGVGAETKVQASFDIYACTFDPNGMLHLIYTQPLFYYRFFMEESTNSYAEKSRFRIRYRDISDKRSSISVEMSKDLTTAGTFNVITPTVSGVPTSEARNIPANLPKVSVKLSKANSRQMVNEFLEIYRVLFIYYRLMRYYLDGLYKRYVPSTLRLQELRDRQRKQKENQTIISAASVGIKQSRQGADDSAAVDRLARAAPNIFISGYSRRCQRAYPTVVPKEDVERRRREQFVYKGTTFTREVIEFPPGSSNPEVYLTCDHPDKPFIGVKYNKLDNNDKYNCIPCCYPSYRLGHNSDYEKCKTGQLLPSSGAKSSTTDKIIDPGVIAELSQKEMELTLRRYTTSNVKLKRIGIPVSPNSLLHAISMAVNRYNYSLMSVEQREVHVTNLRRDIGRLPPALCKQELYDKTDAEITAMLSDVTSFLDTELFFRAVEEKFGINLYVIKFPNKYSSSKEWSIEVPRHRLFHAHSFRPELPTVVVFKNSSVDKPVFYHYELLGEFDETTNREVDVFGADMTTHCQELLRKTITIYNYQPNIEYSKFALAVNTFYNNNYVKNMRSRNMEPIAQIIDTFGKMRGIIFRAGSATATMIIPPAAPLALPQVEKSVNTDLNVALSLMPIPAQALDLDDDGQIIGVWTGNSSIPYMMYVPVSGTPVSAATPNLPRGPPNPLTSERRQVTHRVHKIERDLSMIKQIIKWLYSLYKLTEPSSPEIRNEAQHVDNFFFRYFEIDIGDVIDSAYYYDLSKLGRHLPHVNSVPQAIEFLRSKSPSMIANDKMVLYSKEFALRLSVMLKKHLRLTFGRPIKLQDVFAGYFTSSNDFKQQNNVDILISQKDYDIWFIYRLMKFNLIQLVTNIETRFAHVWRNYLYRTYSDNSSVTYLVQNVSSGSLFAAYTVAKEWLEKGTNPGFNSIESMPTSEPNLRLYEVTPTIRPRVVREPANPNAPFLTFLHYVEPGNNVADAYAAMLPLRT